MGLRLAEGGRAEGFADFRWAEAEIGYRSMPGPQSTLIDVRLIDQRTRCLNISISLLQPAAHPQNHHLDLHRAPPQHHQRRVPDHNDAGRTHN